MDLTFFCFDVQTILKKTLENLTAMNRYKFGIDDDVTESCKHEYAKKKSKNKTKNIIDYGLVDCWSVIDTKMYD